MSARVIIERTRVRRPSSTRSVSTADERPSLSSVARPPASPAIHSHDFVGSSEEDWDSLDEAEFARREPRLPRPHKRDVQVQVRPAPERRESSRVSRHRYAAPEPPEAARRPASRQSERSTRDLKDLPERTSHRNVQLPPEPRRRGSSDHSEGMSPYEERKFFPPGHHAPRYTNQPYTYASSNSDSYGGYNPQGTASQMIQYQQYHPQGYYAPGPLVSPYAQPNPLSPPHSVPSSYFAHEPYRNAQPSVPVMAYGYYPYAMPPAMAPPTPRNDIEDDRFIKLQELILTQETARTTRERERELKLEAEEKAMAALAAKVAADKVAKQAVWEAASRARAEAENAAEERAMEAKVAHEKALALAKAAEAAAKAEAAKHKPSDDSLKAPIKFKDAIGRKFSFPWRVCKTWEGMEDLIQQAFMHVEEVSKQVQARHYDLLGPNGEIILPQVWESTIEPDWQISMHLWPLPEKKKQEEPVEVVIPQRPSRREVVEYDMWGRKKTKKRTKSEPRVVVVPPQPSSSKRSGVPAAAFDSSMPPPPPPAPVPPPAVGPAPIVVVGKDKKRNAPQQMPPLTAWMAGSMGVRARSKK